MNVYFIYIIFISLILNVPEVSFVSFASPRKTPGVSGASAAAQERSAEHDQRRWVLAAGLPAGPAGPAGLGPAWPVGPEAKSSSEFETLMHLEQTLDRAQFHVHGRFASFQTFHIRSLCRMVSS